MAIDKRTIISSKRARNKRKKAQRASAKALNGTDSAGRPECDSSTGPSSGDEAVPTAVPLANVDRTIGVALADALAVCLQLADDSAAGQDLGDSAARSDNQRHDSEAGEEEDDDEEDDEFEDDDELVFVCRPTMRDFCTEFVSTSEAFAVQPSTRAADDKDSSDLRRFTVRIPAFRETREGFITYSITVSTCGDSRRQFQLERRYSEFVEFAQALDLYVQSKEYRRLKDEQAALHDAESKSGGSSDNNPSSGAPFRWELPPKTWFRVTQVTALEDRRSKLEASLQALLSHERDMVCHIPVVRDFLMLDIFGAQMVEEKLQDV